MSDLEQPLAQTNGDEKPDEEAGPPEGTFEIASIAGMICFCTDFNDGMFGSFFATWFYERGLTPADVGGSYIWMAAGLLLVSPVVVRCLKNYKANVVQFWGSWFFIATRASLLLAPILPDSALLPLLCISWFFTGIAYGITEIAAFAWVIMSVESKYRTRAYGKLMEIRCLATVLAPTLGGVLFDFGGFHAPIATGCLLFTLALLVFSTRILSKPPPESRNIATNSGTILKNPPVLVLSLFNFFIMATMCTMVVWFQPMFYYSYRVSATVFGLCVMATPVAFIIGASIAEKLPSLIGPNSSLAVGVVVIALGTLWYGPSPVLAPYLPAPAPATVWEPVVGILIFSAGAAILLVIIPPQTAQYSVSAGWLEEDAASQAAMLNIVGSGAAVGAGPAIAGPLVSKYGYPNFALGLAAVIAILGLVPPAFTARWDKTHRQAEPKYPQTGS